MDGDIHHSCMIFLLYIRYRKKATPSSIRHGRSMAKKVIDTKHHHRCCCIRYCVKNSIDEWMKQTMDRRTQVTTGSYRLLKTRHDQRKSNVIRIVILIYMIQGLCGIESRIEEQYGRARNPSIRQSMGNTFGCIPWLFWIQQHLVYQHRLLLVSSLFAGDIFFVRSFCDGLVVPYDLIPMRSYLVLLRHWNISPMDQTEKPAAQHLVQ